MSRRSPGWHTSWFSIGLAPYRELACLNAQALKRCLSGLLSTFWNHSCRGSPASAAPGRARPVRTGSGRRSCPAPWQSEDPRLKRRTRAAGDAPYYRIGWDIGTSQCGPIPWLLMASADPRDEVECFASGWRRAFLGFGIVCARAGLQINVPERIRFRCRLRTRCFDVESL